jgi:hypothetical protein
MKGSWQDLTPLLPLQRRLQVGEDDDDDDDDDGIIVVLCLHFRSTSAAEMYLLLPCSVLFSYSSNCCREKQLQD